MLLAAVATLHASYWSMSALASGGPLGFGYYNATALQHGTGHLYVAYSDGDKDDVLLRWWNGSAWQVQTVDDGRDVARAIDLAFNASNQPALSYAGGALKFAERSGATWTVKSIESSARNDVTSLKFYGGEPAISYYVTTTPKKGPAVSTLKLARRNGTTWTKTSVGTGVRYSSLAFDGAGNPAIAYAGDANGDGFADSLRLARLVGGTWSVETINNDSRGAGTWARLGFDATGSPFVVDSPSGIGAVRFWYTRRRRRWQEQEIGVGFRPALLVHNGAPIVSYVARMATGCRRHARSLAAGPRNWLPALDSVISVNRASPCPMAPTNLRWRTASISTASTRPGRSGWPARRLLTRRVYPLARF